MRTLPKEFIIGIGIVLAVLLIIVPIPHWMMDFLVMINIGFALMILLNALYAKESMSMNAFPTILLITTVFSLVLNLSATRLILGTGFAGNVIQVFGEVVVQGNLVLGFIIFAVIVIVNFLVITKGSERVAEVGARFTLDAMPGKQMAVDADLNAGAITDDEAKERRKKITDEASFFGAMDGAAKFVKNNAIAAILITVINLIGGTVMGATGLATGEPMEIGDAFQVFSMMTIGDGLVGQIPALLIAVATGILVTKTTSEDGVTAQIGQQMFSQSIVLYIAGGALAFLGLFGGLPWYFFVPFGILLVFLGTRLARKKAVASIATEIGGMPGVEGGDAAELEEIRRPENVNTLLGVDPITLFIGYGLIPLVETSQGGDLMDRAVMIRRQIALELGTVVPMIRVRDNIKLPPSEYRIHIKGVEVAGGDIMFDHYMAMNPGYIEEEIDGIETVEPYLGLPALWINESQRERAEALGYTVVDPPAIIATHLTEVIKSHLHELMSRQDVQNLVGNIREANSVLIEELVPKMMNYGEIQKVLSNLLREGVSIRDLVTILETLADYAQITRDSDMLTEYVRQALKRSISRKYFAGEMNSVITVDPNLEQQIMQSVTQTEQGSYLALDPAITQQIFDNLSSEVNKLTSMGRQPIILTSPVVRAYFKRLVEPIAPDLVVLSYNELEANAEIQSIGMVSIA
ncbi:MAG: flagellar biosynthesis protein FlhA [Defluviitaleaceae bacterium]|nr:flagellar biosynthesis protein FlhA [Defluviitaleaceae bacterium]